MRLGKPIFFGCFVHTLGLPKGKDEIVVGAKEACLSCGDASFKATVYLCGKLVHFSDQIPHC